MLPSLLVEAGFVITRGYGGYWVFGALLEAGWVWVFSGTGTGTWIYKVPQGPISLIFLKD
jgi:hypothetical protein